MLPNFAVVREFCAAILEIAAFKLKQIFQLVFERDRDLHELNALTSQWAKKCVCAVV